MSQSETAQKATAWEAALRTFIAQKQRGSGRTAEIYGGVLAQFFDPLDKTPDQVTRADVFGFAYGVGPSGKKPSASTINLRLTAISNYYKFLMGIQFVNRNPTEHISRPRVEPPPPQSLDLDEIKRLLAAIPDTPAGARDRSIILFCLLTGRRRSEVLRLRAQDISPNGDVYSYTGKGHVTKTKQLPDPAFLAILAGLEANGRELKDLGSEERLFDVSVQGFYLNFRRYVRNAGLPRTVSTRALRHTAAIFLDETGTPIGELSELLDHSSPAVTPTYLRRNPVPGVERWRPVATLLGIG